MRRGGHVLAASALLCLLFEEFGAARIERVLPEPLISVANLAEVRSKLGDRRLDGSVAKLENGCEIGLAEPHFTTAI